VSIVLRLFPVLLLAAAASTAAAQPVIIGAGNLKPSVEVNLGALDDLDRPQGSTPKLKLKMPGAAPAKAPQTRATNKTTARVAAAPKPPPLAKVPVLRPPAIELPSVRVSPPQPSPAPVLAPAAPPVPMVRPAEAAPALVSTAAAPPPSRPAPAAEVAAAPPPSPPPSPPMAPPAPAPERAAAPAPAIAPAVRPPPAAPPRTAALAPESTSVSRPTGDAVLSFTPGEATLTPEAMRKLNEFSAMLMNSEAKVQLMAYSSAGGEGGSNARRLSLSRGLAVRNYLMDRGIRMTRITLRPFGQAADDGLPDRVDLVIEPR
jgi:outer membrane protein OmpA-like peptidoglycan-associated protein